MNANYNALTVDNRVLVDEFIDFLFARQEQNKKETLEAMKEYEEGKSIGPFNSVKDFMIRTEKGFVNVKVIIHWDDKAEVWVAVCDELNIALESGSYDALIEKVRAAISEMMKLNGISNIKLIEISTNERQIIYA